VRQKKLTQAVAVENPTSEQQESKPGMEGLSRRTFLGVGSASLASAAIGLPGCQRSREIRH